VNGGRPTLGGPLNQQRPAASGFHKDRSSDEEGPKIPVATCVHPAQQAAAPSRATLADAIQG
jgi:hypothetical protein